jgi:hypothetical protein
MVQEEKTMRGPDEETALVVPKEGPPKKKLSIKFNIEILRFYGLLAGVLLSLVGASVTNIFVEFPKGSGGWHPEETFIYKLFHFNHTCTVLDFNPAKTVSALVIMFHTVPMNMFVVLAYYRIKMDHEQGQVPDGLLLYSRITSPFIFMSFMYFYMVFVNSPDGDGMTENEFRGFTLHYIPYMFWQIGMVLQSLEQCLYIIYKKQDIPFGLSAGVLKGYCVFIVALGMYYTVFIWSFILRSPILDTTEPVKNVVAQVIMYTFDFVVVIIPAIFAYVQSKNGNDSIIEFHDTDEYPTHHE